MVLAAKRCNDTASFAMITHTEVLTASGLMATLAHGCGVTSIGKKGRGDCKRPRICPKRKKMAKLPLSPAGEIHTLDTRPWYRKAHKALRGVAGLERPIGALQGPFDIAKPRAASLLGGRSPAYAVFTRTDTHRTHTHARTHTHTHTQARTHTTPHTKGVVHC